MKMLYSYQFPFDRLRFVSTGKIQICHIPRDLCCCRLLSQLHVQVYSSIYSTETPLRPQAPGSFTPTVDNKRAILPNASSHHFCPKLPPANARAGKGKIIVKKYNHEGTSKCHQPTHFRPLDHAQLRSANQLVFPFSSISHKKRSPRVTCSPALINLRQGRHVVAMHNNDRSYNVEVVECFLIALPVPHRHQVDVLFSTLRQQLLPLHVLPRRNSFFFELNPLPLSTRRPPTKCQTPAHPRPPVEHPVLEGLLPLYLNPT